jgi:hypothetical protein
MILFLALCSPWTNSFSWIFSWISSPFIEISLFYKQKPLGQYSIAFLSKQPLGLITHLFLTFSPWASYISHYQELQPLGLYFLKTSLSTPNVKQTQPSTSKWAILIANPLKGEGVEHRPTRMCGLDLWLKPFKGGYSINRRVVN